MTIAAMTPAQVLAAKKAKRKADLIAKGYTFRTSGGLEIGTAPAVSTTLIMTPEERAQAQARMDAGQWGAQAQSGGGLTLGGGGGETVSTSRVPQRVPVVQVAAEAQESTVKAAVMPADTNSDTGRGLYSTTGRTSTGGVSQPATKEADAPQSKTGLLLAAITAGFYFL